jgi:hypothetical protein
MGAGDGRPRPSGWRPHPWSPTASGRPAQALPPGSLLEQLQPTLGRDVRVAGETLRFETDDPRVLALAEELFATYGPPAADAGEPLLLRVLVHAPRAPEPLFAKPVYRTHGHLFTVALGPHDSGAADVLAGRAFAIVSPDLVAQGWRLQQQVLATLALALLGPARGYLPLHAACLTRGGRSVLVHGPSGAGKSTFTYAAVRRGYGVVSEDALQIAPDGRVWGLPWQFQLLPDVPHFFPELAGHEPRLQANGEWKIDVDLAGLHPGRVAPSAPLGPLLLLARRPGPTSIERVPDDEAAALVEPVWPWQVGWTAAQQATLDEVRRQGVHRFVSGAAPDAMVDALDAFLASAGG